MKDLTKLTKAISDLARDDAEIRNQFKVFRTLTEHQRPPLNAAGGRTMKHKQQVLIILKKLMDVYTTEIKGVHYAAFSACERADKVLRLARRLGGAA